MENPTDFFRKTLREFKVADELLSKQLEAADMAASAQLVKVTDKAGQAERIAIGCLKALDIEDSAPANFDPIKISPPIDADFLVLKNLMVKISDEKNELKLIKDRIKSRKDDLEKALIKAEANRRKKRIVYALTAAVAICAIVIFHFWLLSGTTLSYTFSLDGKDLPSGTNGPILAIDGKPLAAGSKINLGHHEIAITFPGSEPFTKKIWTFYGKNNLGILPLQTSKGSLSVTVRPSPAIVFVKRGEKIIVQGDAPLKAEGLPVDNYIVLVRLGEYEESHVITIERQQQTQTNIVLDLGSLDLSSMPPDAQFKLAGNEQHWEGKLPVKIDFIPSDNYSLIVSRNGWEQTTDIAVSRDRVTTKTIEFPYGSIVLTSDPSGLNIYTNGIEIGKTPMTIPDVIPGHYMFSVSDGENDLTHDINVIPKEAAKDVFIFHYGAVQLSSRPAGATIVRKGKEIGKTPLLLNHIPAGETTLELQFQGYVSTNISILAVADITSQVSVSLISQHYLDSMKQSQDADDNGQYSNALEFVSTALAADPDNKAAIALKNSLSFKIHSLNSENYLSGDHFDEAFKELAEAAKFSPDPQVVTQLKNKISSQKLKRFDDLIQEAENALSRNASDSAASQLAEAEKLYPDNPKLTALRKRMGPGLRDKLWRDFTKQFADSAFSGTATFKYSQNLQQVQSGTEQALRRLFSIWKLQEISKTNGPTVLITLAPAGITAKIGYGHDGAMMLSQLEDGFVEMRVKFWIYPPDYSNPDNVRQSLRVQSNNLFINLKGTLGEPIRISNTGL